MFGPLPSFLIGMAIAAAILGAAVLLYNAATNEGPQLTVLATPTATRLVTSATPTRTPSTATAGATSVATGTTGTPAVPGTPAAGGTPGATATFPAGNVQPTDRTSCAAIQGSDYRSDSERLWYLANCPVIVPTTRPATLAPSQPAPTPTPVRPPYLNAFASLVVDYRAAVGTLAAQIGEPEFVNETWRGETVAAAEELRRIGGVARRLTVPACLGSAQQTLFAAAQELDLAADLAVSGATIPNATLLELAAERLDSARVSLPEAARLADTSGCS